MVRSLSAMVDSRDVGVGLRRIAGSSKEESEY